VCRRLPACLRVDAMQCGVAWRWPAREHPSGSFGDVRSRRHPRESGAGRVSPSRASAPAQASAQLWTPGALRRQLSTTTSFTTLLYHTLSVVTDNVVRTVSKVLCLRPLRTSRCYFAVPVSVAAARNDTRLQLFLQLACDAAGRTPSPQVSCWEDACRSRDGLCFLQPQSYLCAAAWYVDLTDLSSPLVDFVQELVSNLG